MSSTLSPTCGAILVGVEAKPVLVEAAVLPGPAGFSVNGVRLAKDLDLWVRETYARVRSAIEASGFDYPRGKVVLTLQLPEGITKPDTALDLPVAIAILTATGQVPALKSVFYGELSLSGEIRTLRGTLAVAKLAGSTGKVLVTAKGSAYRAADIAPTAGAPTLRDAVSDPKAFPPGTKDPNDFPTPEPEHDLSDIRDLDPEAVEGLVLAARTGRPLLIIAPRGCGASMVARRFVGALGVMSTDHALDVAVTHDAAGLCPTGKRPFRAPHHTVSQAGLVGDRRGRPGEATLADRGVLLLDEVVEFPRAVLDALRAVQGARQVQLGAATLPARFLLVATVTPEDASSTRLNHPVLADAVRVELKKGDFGRWPTTADVAARASA